MVFTDLKLLEWLTTFGSKIDCVLWDHDRDIEVQRITCRVCMFPANWITCIGLNAYWKECDGVSQ